MRESFFVASLKELDEFAGKFAFALRGGESVGLVGELGAGKTTFVKHLLKHLKGEGEAASPSFTIFYLYSTESHLAVEHWDLYRLPDTPIEILEPPDENVIRLIEWADKIPDCRSIVDCVIHFKLLPGRGEEEREIIVERRE